MLPARSADRELLQIVDGPLADAASRAGGFLACHPGCAVCCFGPFAITALDAVRLREGMAALEDAEPSMAEGIRGRAAQAVERLRANFPGDGATGLLWGGAWDESGFAETFQDLACPALDPGSGACLLYEHRPVACRTYGLPVRLNGEDLPPCPLCFCRASRDEVERCRAVIDPDGAADRIVAAMEAKGMKQGRTVIAFALAGVWE